MVSLLFDHPAVSCTRRVSPRWFAGAGLCGIPTDPVVEVGVLHHVDTGPRVLCPWVVGVVVFFQAIRDLKIKLHNM